MSDTSVKPSRPNAPARRPRIVRAMVERFAPTRASLRQQCDAANRADRADNWQRFIYWPDE